MEPTTFFWYQASLPATCSFSRWEKEGKCSGDYTGFGDLFNTDITIRMSATNCGDENFPSIQAQCVGQACAAVFGPPVTCSADSQCPSGLVCRPLTSLGLSKLDFDALYLASIAEDNRNYFFNDTSRERCAGSSFFVKDLQYFLDLFGQSQPGGNAVCQLNVTRLTPYFPEPYDPEPNPTVQYWMNKAYQGVVTLGNVRELLLGYFSSWSN